MRDVWGQFRHLMRGRTFHALRAVFHTYFSPREARFLIFLKSHPEIPPDMKSFDFFEELIPFTRREEILAHFHAQIAYLEKRTNLSASGVFWRELESYSHIHAHPPLQRHEFRIVYDHGDD